MDLRLIKKLMGISILKSLVFNMHYFGLKGITCPVIVYKNMRLSKLGGGVSLSTYHTGLVQLGAPNICLVDNRMQRGIWENAGQISFKGRAVIGAGSKISVAGKGKLSFGKNFRVNATSEIVCAEEMSFGEDVLLSWDCLAMDTDFHHIAVVGEKDSDVSKSIVVGNHCWIGCRTVILKGVHLANNIVVAANSTIVKSISEENTVVGTPGIILKRNVKWHD